MRTLRAIGFDLDGTLFDHRGSARDGVHHFLRSLGVEPSPGALESWFTAEDIQFERWRSGEISFEEQRRQRLRAVLPTVGVTLPADVAELDALFDGYLQAYRRSWQAFPDSRALIDRLRASGYRVGLLTNGAQAQQLDKLHRTDLFDGFDTVCISEHLGVQKPDPQAFAILARRLGVAPEECLFVGDHQAHDVDGARSAGMRGLLVDRYATHVTGIADVVLGELRAGVEPAR